MVSIVLNISPTNLFALKAAGLVCLSDQTCVSEMSALDYCPLSTSYDIKSKYCEAQGKDKGKGGQGKVFDLKVIY